MLILTVILGILILAYSVVTVPYVTIDIDYSSDKLVVWVYAWFIKRKFVVGFDAGGEPNETKTEKNSDKDNKTADNNNTAANNGSGEPVSPIRSKIQNLKSRVFSEDKGFDMDEAKAAVSDIKEEFLFIWSLLRRFFSAMRYKIKIPVWRITLDFGTDNAAATGMLYGSIWGAVGTVYPLLTRYAYVVYPLVDITPDFYGKRFDIKMKSIIKVRPLHIINAAVPPLLTYLKEYLKTASKQNKKDKI